MTSHPPLPPAVRNRKDLEVLLAAATNYEELRPRSPTRPVFKLERVRAMLASVGDPHVGPRTVHIAGSKGKGTTARMVDAILRRGGRGSVGLYTSPHLEDLSERIRVDGEPATDDAMARAADRLLPHVRRVHGTTQAVTFFEMLTGMAWLVFREHSCRDVVLETGLGGRLDATNVCDPAVTLITSIELEHTDILGATLPEVASEKAGILKAGVPAATSATGDALRTIRARAEHLGVRLAVVGRDIVATTVSSTGGPGLDLVLTFADGSRALPVEVGVSGRHHLGNVALAAWAGRHLGIADEGIHEALEDLVLPGILEPLGGDPVVVVDGAHTQVSARGTIEAAEATWGTRRRVLLVAMLAGKNAPAIAAELVEGTAHVVTTSLPTPRSMDAEALAAVLGAATDAPVEACADRGAALDRARELAGPGGLVLATGSVRLAGWVRSELRRRGEWPPKSPSVPPL